MVKDILARIAYPFNTSSLHDYSAIATRSLIALGRTVPKCTLRRKQEI